MTRRVALLRGVSIGGATKVPMAALRALVEVGRSERVRRVPWSIRFCREVKSR